MESGIMEYCKMCQNLMDRNKELQAKVQELEESYDVLRIAGNIVNSQRDKLEKDNVEQTRVIDKYDRTISSLMHYAISGGILLQGKYPHQVEEWAEAKTSEGK